MQAALRGAKRPSGEGDPQEDENGEPKKPKAARKAKAAPKAPKVAEPKASSGSAKDKPGDQEVETPAGDADEPSKTKPDLSAMWKNKD